jgi:hypothetical protein
MTKQTKILIGVGVVALAYYLYTKRKGSGVISQVNDKTPQKPYMPQVNPYSEGGALEPKHQKPSIKNSDDFTFEVLENFSAEFFSSTTGKFTNANFKKGQIIHAKPIPMGNTSGLATTPDGKYPIMDMIGNAIVNVPANKLKRIN